MSPLTPAVSIDGPVAFRALARAFSQFDDFQRFVTGLGVALEKSAPMGQTALVVDGPSAGGAAGFPRGNLTLPIAAGAQRFGALQVAPAPGRRLFGPEDLHLLAGLADFLGVAIAQSLRMQDAARSRELLRFLLDQAPVGIAAFGSDHRPIVANELATRWIGETALPFADWEKGAAGFHLRTGGKLVYGEARRMPAGAGAWFVVLHDLTGEHAQLLELLKRETYRALAEGGDVAFALIEGPGTGTLRVLPEIRGALGPDEAAGPYDAHRLGLVLRGARGLPLRARLRRLRAQFGTTEEFSLGYAELGRDGRTPDALLGAALGHRDRFEVLLRPAVLVQDEHPDVTATFAMVLGQDYRVVKSNSAARTRELLAAERFEAFVTEREPRNGPAGAELGRLARELQPGIRLFLTTMQPTPEPEDDAVLIGKPFDVAALRETLRNEIERVAR